MNAKTLNILDQIFLEARTHSTWLDKAVPLSKFNKFMIWSKWHRLLPTVAQLVLYF